MALFDRFSWSSRSTRRAGIRRRAARRLAVHEPLEERTVLSASGFAGNPCAPDLDLSAIAPQTVRVGGTLDLNLAAIGGTLTDDETPAADLRWLMDPDVGEDFPTGATLTSDGVFSWTPTAAQEGVFEVFLIGIDRGTPALADSEKLTITVQPASDNSPPDIRLSGLLGEDFSGDFTEDGGPVPIVGVSGQASALQVIDSDSANLGPVTVTLTNRPDGAAESLDVNENFSGFTLNKSYDPNTGVLTISGAAFSGIYQGVLRSLTYNNTSQNPTEVDRTITVVISDGEDNSPIRTSTITVTAAPDAPVIDPIATQEVVVNNTLTVPVSANDVDGDAIALTLDPARSPAGSTLVDNGDGTGTITWTPDTVTFPNPVEFRVLANGGAAAPDGAALSFNAVVHEVNIAPMLNSIANSTVTAGQLFTVNVSATDANTIPQTLTLTLDPENQPEGAVLTDNGDGTGTITWQTDNDDVGQATFGVLVTDNGFPSLGDSEDFTVTVQAT